jgi:WD40 repeat protein
VLSRPWTLLVVPVMFLSAGPGRGADPIKAARVDAHGDALPAGAVARLGTTRFRLLHPSDLVGFTPDAKALVLLEHDGTLRFLDARSGKGLRQVRVDEFRRQGYVGEAAAVSGDGRTAVAGNPFSQLTLVDVASGKTGRRIPNSELFVQNNQGYGLYNFAYRLSHDGRFLGVVGQQINGITLIAWVDTLAGKRLHHQMARNRAYFCPPVFSRDSKQVAAVEVDPALGQSWLRLWDVASGNELHTALVPLGVAQGLAFLPDGKSLILLGQPGQPLVQIEAATGKELRRFADREVGVQSFTLAPDGKSLFTGSPERVCQWDVATGKELRHFALPGQAGGAKKLVVADDGSILAACGTDFLAAWELTTGLDLVPAGGHTGVVDSLAFTPAGDRLLTAGSDFTARWWDLAGVRELRLLKPGTRPPEIPQYPPHNGRSVRDAFGSQALLSPDGKVLATVWPRCPLQLWTADGTKPARTLGQGSYQAIAFSADGKLLAGASHDGQIVLWDVGTGKEVRRFSLCSADRAGAMGNLSMSGLAFSADGRALAAGGFPDQQRLGQPELSVWELGTGGERLHVKPAGGDAHRDVQNFGIALPPQADALADRLLLSLTFSPDSKYLAVGGGHGVYLFDLGSGREARQFTGPRLLPRAVAFSPDGQLLAVGQLDGSIRLWRLASGLVLRDLPAHELAVTALAFSPDGRRLASGSMDSTVLLWDVSQVVKDAPGPKAGLEAKQLEALWQDLGSADAARAFRAIGTLVEHPDQAVPLLKQHLRPIQAVDPKRLERLVKELDDGRYAVRQKAMRELEQLADLAAPALQKLLAGNPSAETRQRADKLLRRLDGAINSPALLAGLRGIEVLEHIGNGPARELLQALAAGAPGHRLTTEAAASLHRLTAK